MKNLNTVKGKISILSIIVIALMFTIVPGDYLSASLLKSGGHPTPNFTALGEKTPTSRSVSE